MAPHSSTLAWKIPWTEEPGRLQSRGSLRVRHDWETSLSLFTFMHWSRKWQPTPVSLPGESQGWWSLVGCRLWGRTESDTTEATQQQQQKRIVFLVSNTLFCKGNYITFYSCFFGFFLFFFFFYFFTGFLCFLIFWPSHVVCGILVLQPVIEPTPDPPWKVESSPPVHRGGPSSCF